MIRKSKKVTIENVDITSTELAFCDAADLLPDLVAAIGPSGGAWNEGSGNLGDVIGMLAEKFTSGGLVRYLGRLLSCTSIVDKDAKVKVELLDSREKLDEAFTGRQKLVPVAVKLALEVSFKDFLEGLALAGLKIPTLSPSAVSVPSTTATG